MTNKSGPKGGRPRKNLTEDEIVQVGKLAAYLTQEQIADFLGISERTLRNRIAEDERVSAAYKRGKAKSVAAVANNLVRQAMSGNITAAIFYLKTQGKWSETHKHEVTGADGEPIVSRVEVVVVDAKDDPS